MLNHARNRAAAVEVRKAAVRRPYDPVGLRILADAERAGGKAVEADQEIALASRNWAGDIAAPPAALM